MISRASLVSEPRPTFRLDFAIASAFVFNVANTIWIPYPFRMFYGVPFALIYPGWCIGKLLRLKFRKDGIFERLLLQSLLGIASFSPMMLVLFVLNRGVNLVSVQIEMGVLGAGAALMSIGERVGLGLPRSPEFTMTTAEEEYPCDFVLLDRAGNQAGRFRSLKSFVNSPFLLLGVFPIGALALASAHVSLPHQPTAQYTEFGFDGGPALADRSPSYLVGTQLQYPIFVRNKTGQSVHYRIESGIGSTAWSKVEMTVKAGETWKGTLVGKVPKSGCLDRFNATLEDSNGDALGPRLSVPFDTPESQCN